MGFIIRFVTRLVSLVLLLLALVVIGMRIGLANIDHFESEIKNWLSSEIASGVSFVDIQGGWNQFNPIIRLQNAAVILPDQIRPISVDEMAVEVNLIDSILNQALVIREVSGAIKDLHLRKDLHGQWWLNNTHIGGASSDNSTSSIATLISKIPHYLDLELKQLSIDDEAADSHYEVETIQLDLLHHESEVHLELTTSLPGSLGQKMLLKSIIKPDSSLIYLKMQRLELIRLAQLLGINSGGLEQAEMSGELWINLIDKELVSLSGDLSLNDGLLRINPESRLHSFDVSSAVNVWRSQDDWIVSNQGKELRVDNKSLRPFDSEIRLTGSGNSRRVAGWINIFELYNLRVLDEKFLSTEFADILRSSELQGELSNIWFNFDPSQPGNLRFQADATNVASKPANGVPGIGYFDASIVYGNRNATVNLSGSHMTLDFADQFPAPLKLEAIDLDVTASLVADELLISIPSFTVKNEDLTSSGRLWLEAGKSVPPFMYLRAEFADADGSSASKYVPVKIMPEKVVDWIGQGIKRADSPHGDLLYHGRLRNIKQLVDDRAGELIVDFQVENAEVLFDKNWPVARNGEGRVIFHNLGVNVDLETVSLDAVEHGIASISIADFRQAEVAVDVKATTPTDIGLKTWIKTPVGQNYDSIVKKFRQVGGQVDARINVLIPISRTDKQPQVDVKLDFSASHVDIPDWGLNLTDIDGLLQVTDKHVKAEAIQANYFGDPINVDVYTDSNKSQTIIKTQGDIQSRELLRLLPKYMKNAVKGKSEWQVDIGIANNSSKKGSPIVEIDAKSEMKSTEILFPDPFQKPAGNSRATRIQVSILDDRQIDFNLSYGAGVKSQGTLTIDELGDYQLQNLGIGFSTDLRPLPVFGISIYGALGQLPLDNWFAYYRSQIKTGGGDASALVELMDSIDLEVGSTTLFSNKLDNSYLNLQRQENDFRADIDSSMIKGSFEIPINQSPTNPVVATLDYLRLRSNKDESDSVELFPEDLLNLQLSSELLSYDDMVFADLVLDSKLDGDEFTLKKLAFRNSKVQLDSSATWQYARDTGNHHSTASISIVGAEFGQSMSSLGLGDSMQGGDILLDAEVKWAGELHQLDWDSLSGNATLLLSNGFLNNVDPGSGRIVGLLSLSALPRRLALDFNDVLFEGLKFDRIAGTYSLSGADIYTSNTRMESPSAKVDISGRVGLLARDYDQKMIITPRIRHSLPLIGGLALSAGVGWGLLVLQNLFKDEIDKSVQAEYRITGTWSEPQVELVKKVVYDRVKTDK